MFPKWFRMKIICIILFINTRTVTLKTYFSIFAVLIKQKLTKLFEYKVRFGNITTIELVKMKKRLKYAIYLKRKYLEKMRFLFFFLNKFTKL